MLIQRACDARGDDTASGVLLCAAMYEDICDMAGPLEKCFRKMSTIGLAASPMSLGRKAAIMLQSLPLYAFQWNVNNLSSITIGMHVFAYVCSAGCPNKK